jgi:hypothetical protein
MKIKTKKKLYSKSNRYDPKVRDVTSSPTPISLVDLVAKRYARSAVLICATSLAFCMNSCMIPYENHTSNAGGYSGYQNGYKINTLPYGYRREILSGNTYYYHDGYYYRRSSDGYMVTDAPQSSRYYGEYERLRQSRYARTSPYGERRDRYDRQTYERRESVSQLPSGYRVVEYGGRKYYKHGDRYYVREDGRYYVVARPY